MRLTFFSSVIISFQTSMVIKVNSWVIFLLLNGSMFSSILQYRCTINSTLSVWSIDVCWFCILIPLYLPMSFYSWVISVFSLISWSLACHTLFLGSCIAVLSYWSVEDFTEVFYGVFCLVGKYFSPSFSQFLHQLPLGKLVFYTLFLKISFEILAKVNSRVISLLNIDLFLLVSSIASLKSCVVNPTIWKDFVI